MWRGNNFDNIGNPSGLDDGFVQLQRVFALDQSRTFIGHINIGPAAKKNAVTTGISFLDPQRNVGLTPVHIILRTAKPNFVESEPAEFEPTEPKPMVRP
jgi:hypothetical protein